MEPPIDIARLSRATVNLDAWAQSIRCPGGYGGPVSHWWQDSYRYVGRGLDWRYEGFLTGYRALYEATGDGQWLDRLRIASGDLIAGQNPDGSYAASQFEMNPGTLGTPHEAAASFGLISAARHLEEPEAAIEAVGRNLQNLIGRLWDVDARGFNDRPGIRGRVPNKLATLAVTLITWAEVTREDRLLPYAMAALDSVVAFQVPAGRWGGAVHQYSADGRTGDGRLFPYYNARCVPGLLAGARVLGVSRYRDSAFRILEFIEETRDEDGSWPQVVYASSVRRAEWPRWTAGAADILLTYHALGQPIPRASLERLLQSQMPSGGFPTAEGFGRRERALGVRGLLCGPRSDHGSIPDFRDVVPVAGWNDKVFRLLTGMVPEGTRLPLPSTADTVRAVRVSGEHVVFRESSERMLISGGREPPHYLWTKGRPWALASLEVARA